MASLQHNSQVQELSIPFIFSIENKNLETFKDRPTESFVVVWLYTFLLKLSVQIRAVMIAQLNLSISFKFEYSIIKKKIGNFWEKMGVAHSTKENPWKALLVHFLRLHEILKPFKKQKHNAIVNICVAILLWTILLH